MSDHSISRHDEYCEFMQRHREIVWCVCWRYAHGDREQCRDMVQEVWLTLWLRYDRLRKDAPECQKRIWIWRMARSVIVDLYRRDRLEFESLTDRHMECLKAEGVDYGECIEEMKESLNEGERTLLQMRLDGYDAGEISRVLGIARNAVYQRINRIIKKLKDCYGK